MTDQAWETLSNQAVAAAGLLYFLSLLSYLVQWASLRHVPVAGRPEGRGRRGGSTSSTAVTMALSTRPSAAGWR